MDISGISRFAKNGLKPSHTLGLMGNHGIGKTSYVHNTLRAIVAEKHKLPIERVHVISRCVSVMDPADLIGNFQEFGGRTYNCPPSWIPVNKAYDDEMEKLYRENGMTYSRLTKYDDIYILFLDECKRGNSVIQDGIMELLLEHRIFGVNLKEDTYVVCADNDNAKIYNGTRRDPAQESRIKNFNFAPTNKEFLEDYANRIAAKSIHPVIHSYLSKYPENIVLPTKTLEDLAIKGQKGPSPRDWTLLGECLQEFAKNGDNLVESRQEMYLAEVASAYIGSSYAMRFAQFCANEFKTNISAKDIIEAKDNDIWNRLKQQYESAPITAVQMTSEVLENICKRKKLSEGIHKNILNFLSVCPREAVTAFITKWQDKNLSQKNEWLCTPKRYMLVYTSITNKNSQAFKNWYAAFMKNNNLTEADMERDDIRI